MRLTVVRGDFPLPPSDGDELVISDSELRGWVVDGRILARLGRCRDARLLTERLATSGRPMLVWALRAMARGRCYIADIEGRERDVTLPLLLRWSWQVVREAAGKRWLLRAIERQVDALEREPRDELMWRRDASPLYLRSDLSFSVRAGGSVGHIAGVANELARLARPPIMVTTSPVPTLSEAIEVHQVTMPERFWNFQELPTLVLNDVCVDEARRALRGRPVSFVYQRYSLNNFAGLRLSRELRVPFVLEYNGSEVWMSRHQWTRPLRYEPIASRIEMLNVSAADLVVVVSRAMRDELVARRVEADRVLVNPNAVDPDRYHPAIDGSRVRARYGLGGATVIGFISTFAPWHGASVLARAFVALLQRRPEYRTTVRLLMIGAGPDAEPSRRILVDAGLGDSVAFTGLVPQEEGPAYLAACDVFASPHLPNRDGTPFFGSPTKLFEYMSMGRAIVASNLDQIGEVLRHDETAWLVPPADVDALADGFAVLVADSARRQRLAAAARDDVLAHHTWPVHVARTLEALAARVPQRG
jgi:glycosyltransferase involved in cell wall biosynthesis